MKASKNSMSPVSSMREIACKGVVIVAILAMLAGMAITATAQSPPKRAVIRAGHLLNVRTGELRANQAIIDAAGQGDVRIINRVELAAGGVARFERARCVCCAVQSFARRHQ